MWSAREIATTRKDAWSFDGGSAGVVEVVLCDLGLVDGHRDRDDCWSVVSGRVDDVHKQRHWSDCVQEQ